MPLPAGSIALLERTVGSDAEAPAVPSANLVRRSPTPSASTTVLDLRGLGGGEGLLSIDSVVKDTVGHLAPTSPEIDRLINVGNPSWSWYHGLDRESRAHLDEKLDNGIIPRHLTAEQAQSMLQRQQLIAKIWEKDALSIKDEYERLGRKAERVKEKAGKLRFWQLYAKRRTGKKLQQAEKNHKAWYWQSYSVVLCALWGRTRPRASTEARAILA